MVHSISHHTQPRPNGGNWNENNAGIALRYALNSSVSAQAGVYRNSINRSSAYALVDWTPLEVGPLLLGGFAGSVTGYSPDPRLMGGLLVRYQPGRFSATVRGVPKVPGNSSGNLSLELGWKF